MGERGASQAEPITGAQCAAARALLRWAQVDLAERSGIGVQTIGRFEKCLASSTPGVSQSAAYALRKSLEFGGALFFDAACHWVAHDPSVVAQRKALRWRAKPFWVMSYG